MLEYASMGLTLFWSTPPTAPRIIVAPAIAPSTGIHCPCIGSSVERNTRANAAKAAAFTDVDMNAVTIVGAPSYASGVHMWNGTADTLKQKPTARRPTARSDSVLFGPDAMAVPTTSSRVEPAIVNANAMPYRKNALENEPSRKYLNAASAPAAFERRK